VFDRLKETYLLPSCQVCCIYFKMRNFATHRHLACRKLLWRPRRPC